LLLLELQFLVLKSNSINVLLEMMQSFYQIDNYSFDYQLQKNNINYIQQNEDQGEIWLFQYDNIIIGYTFISFGFSFEYGGKTALIDELFIKESYRGKGLGKICLNFISKRCASKDVKSLQMEVENHNDGALKLYTDCGFKNKGRFYLTKPM
jgi:ribosomal protein S18 acetylase RimI-like enzyme